MQEIRNCLLQQFGRLLELAQPSIAGVAKQSTDHAGLVVMINRKRLDNAAYCHAFGVFADCANTTLLAQDTGIGIWHDAVFVFPVPIGVIQSLESSRLWTALALPFSLVAHIRPLTFGTPGFWVAARVGRKVPNGFCFATSRTRFLYHNILLFRFAMLYYSICVIVKQVIVTLPPEADDAE